MKTNRAAPLPFRPKWPGMIAPAAAVVAVVLAVSWLGLPRAADRPGAARGTAAAGHGEVPMAPGPPPAAGPRTGHAAVTGIPESAAAASPQRPAGAARGEARRARLKDRQAARGRPHVVAAVQQAKRERALKHPLLVRRLEPVLLEAAEHLASQGPRAALARLGRPGVRVRDDEVTVVIECEPAAAPRAVAAAVAARDATVVRTGTAHVKACVPIAALADIACNVPGVAFVRTPIPKKLTSTVATEGLGATLAAPWLAAGNTGQGVKVAVFDWGFDGLAALKAGGELPASAVEVDFTGYGMADGGDHGCAHAEVLHDMAPGCQLHLLNAADASDDEAAKDYCKANGIHIVSYPSGYDNVNFYDGVAYSSVSPHPVAIVNDAAASGILWLAAAGNSQLKHAMIPWQDADADDFLEWDYEDGYYIWFNSLYEGEGATVPPGTMISGALTWNEWPVSDQDFDLYLLYWNGSSWQVADAGLGYQTGTQPPREDIHHTVDTAGTLVEDYAFVVVNEGATRSPTFILRTEPYLPFYYGYGNFLTPVPGSIGCPADAAACLAVGAIDAANHPNGPLEYYSALGPNNGAHTGHPAVAKPDICGPDWVSTATYGPQGFYGTSAATPHVAGLAALVKGANPGFTPVQVRDYLEGHAVDLGPPGKDNTYGAGAAVLPAPVTPIEAWRQAHFGSPANSGDGADDNDFDGDGIENLLEFAFGLDPMRNSAGGLPAPGRVGADFVVSFAQPEGVGGITYGAEWSTTLLPGSWTAITDTGSGGQHTFSVPAAGNPRLFIRHRVTNP